MAVNTPYKDSTVTTTNHTANYDLPLWSGEDTTSWLTQMNDAMNKIDDGMVDAKSKALEVVGIAAEAKKVADATKAESEESAQIVAGFDGRLTTVETTSVEHTNDITNLNTRSDQFDVELHSVQEVQRKTTADLATLAEKVDSNKTETDGKITDLTETVATNKSELETEIAANTATIAENGENIATVAGRVTALENEVDEVSSATQSNTNAISAINGSIETINAKNTEQDGKISATEIEVNALDGRVATLEEGGSVKSYQSVKRKRLTIPITAEDLLLVRQGSTLDSLIVTDEHPTVDGNFNATLTLFGDGSFFIELIKPCRITSESEFIGFKIFKTNIEELTKEWFADVIGTNVDVWGKVALLSDNCSMLYRTPTTTSDFEGFARIGLIDFQLSTKTLIATLLAVVPQSSLNNLTVFYGNVNFYGHLETVQEIS